MKSDFLVGKTRLRFEALQHALVPRSQALSPSQHRQALLLVNTLISQQEASARRKLKLFLLIIDLFALLRFGANFRQLNSKKQNQVLQAFFDSPIPLIRKGFWGLNTITRLSVYGQSSLHQEIGYSLKENSSNSPRPGDSP